MVKICVRRLLVFLGRSDLDNDWTTVEPARHFRAPRTRTLRSHAMSSSTPGLGALAGASESLKQTVAPFRRSLVAATEAFAVGFVSHLLTQTRRFLALAVASAAAEAVLFLMWVIALLPFWSRDNSRESLRFEAVAHAVAAAVVAAQIFVSREEVLHSFGGDLGAPSFLRAAVGCFLLTWTTRRRPAAVSVGAFGAALIATHGVSWFACFVLSACYQLWSGLPRRGDSAETDTPRAEDVARALGDVGGDAGPSRLGIRRRKPNDRPPLSDPASEQPAKESTKAPVVERAFVDSFEEDAVPGE